MCLGCNPGSLSAQCRLHLTAFGAGMRRLFGKFRAMDKKIVLPEPAAIVAPLGKTEKPVSDVADYAGRRDPRFVTIRRGGTLEDSQHRSLAAWAADCAEHVLDLFCAQRPLDDRPRRAIEQAHAGSRGEISMTQAREAAYTSVNRQENA